MRRIVALIVAALTVSACGLGGNPLEKPQDPASVGPIVVATVPEQERTVIAYIYAEALIKRGYQVRVEEFPSRAEWEKAMVDQKVQIAPDYTGELLLSFDSTNPARSGDEVVNALPGAIDPTMKVLQPAATGSNMTWLVRPDLAQSKGLTSLDQLAEVSKSMTVAIPPDLAEVPNGLLGLTGVYGMKFKKVVKEPNSTRRADDLQKGAVDLTVLRSTDPRGDDFVGLDDSQQINGQDQRLIPVVRRELPKPVCDRIDEVQAKLDDKSLLALTSADAGDPQQAAQRWLKEVGLE